ncbi:hypothetical protein [Chryseobacterium indologenes]|uniref:hypothetical protein n=1 Tax=Chryseobacterium indologenes TaxID=253 RepID=UPI001F4B7EDB|nr:hypothetical protein [Chryseobacterium indologenes]
MEIQGDVINISSDRIRIRLQDKGKKQEVDVFISLKRVKLLAEHVVVERSMVKFSIVIEEIEINSIKLAKLWLDYIIFPTSIKPKPESKRHKDDERPGIGWAQSIINSKK